MAAEHEINTVSGAGKPMFEIYFLNAGEKLTYSNGNSFWPASTYELSATNRAGIEKALAYWANILEAGSQNTKPIQIIALTVNYANAGAASLTIDFANRKNVRKNYLKEALQNNYALDYYDPFDQTTLNGIKAFGLIYTGKHMGTRKAGCVDGWYIDAETILPENEQAADYVSTIRHEMGHLLGIDSKRITNTGEKDSYDNVKAKFQSGEMYTVTDWDMHLVDQNLNPAQPGMEIITSAKFKTIKLANPSAKESDYFIVDNLQTKAERDEDNPRSGQAYFVGKNVTETLHGATFNGVFGLPIRGWEGSPGCFIPELSHLETSGMMSHSKYRNYTTFMEVELAVMQDLGYNIDRKNYYGFSEYGNDKTYTNTNGYSARNAEGTSYLAGIYNGTELGIGLHVYGKRNNISQAADILTIYRQWCRRHAD